MIYKDDCSHDLLMKETESAAWEIYCRLSAGSESARDYWWELSEKDQKNYLDLAKEIAS